jgi:hypothetical protein
MAAILPTRCHVDDTGGRWGRRRRKIDWCLISAL